MSFKLGPKVVIINDPAQVPVYFYAKLASGVKNLIETDDDYQTSAAWDKLAASPDTVEDAEGTTFSPADTATSVAIAQADFMRILGFGDFVGSDIVSVFGTKGIPGVKQVSTLTFTATGIAAAAAANQEIDISFLFTSALLEGEFASELSTYQRKKNFAFPIKATDTVTTLATRLVNEIQDMIDRGWISPWFTATSAAGVVTLTSSKPTITFTSVVSGTAVDAGNVAAAQVDTTAGYAGRNTYTQLKGLRLETLYGDGYAVYQETAQIPGKINTYSSYTIVKTVTRPDLSGGHSGGLNSTPSGNFEFQLLINEQTCAAVIQNVVKWFNANVANRTMYTATTAAAALTGESPTVVSAVAASPFTVGLT